MATDWYKEFTYDPSIIGELAYWNDMPVEIYRLHNSRTQQVAIRDPQTHDHIAYPTIQSLRKADFATTSHSSGHQLDRALRELDLEERARKQGLKLQSSVDLTSQLQSIRKIDYLRDVMKDFGAILELLQGLEQDRTLVEDLKNLVMRVMTITERTWRTEVKEQMKSDNRLREEAKQELKDDLDFRDEAKEALKRDGEIIRQANEESSHYLHCI